jgi:MFS family permease
MKQDTSNPATGAVPPGTRRERAMEFFGLTPDIVAVSTAMFVMGLGENLWRRFLPKYLQSLGAPVTAIGLFGTTEDFLDGVYQYPGGWIADRFGRRAALLLFVSVAALGYALFATMDAWRLAFVALAFSMAWTSMASPTLFAVVGDALPTDKRTMGFTVQSILRRIPIVVAPMIGGIAISRMGLQSGVRLGLTVSIVLAVVTLGVTWRIRIPVVADAAPTHIGHVWQSFPPQLRWLLVSDVFIRTCDAMVDVFLVLYAVNIIGISAPRFGWLLLAFVVGGLREIGEPARKALIIDLVTPSLRARSVGLYYLCRSLAIAPAAFIGGLLWRVSTALPFYFAGAIGVVGAVLFVLTVDAENAG